MPGGKRISLLSKDEYDYLYGIPELTNKDRVVLFDLSEEDHIEINKLSSEAVQIDYILQLGYFRAKNWMPKPDVSQLHRFWMRTQVLKVESI